MQITAFTPSLVSTSGRGVQSPRREADSGDRFAPSGPAESRPDLQLKQAWRQQQSQKSRGLEARASAPHEELSSSFPGREGYDEMFLGRRFPLPTIDPSWASQVATLIDAPDQSELKYGNFSIVMNAERRQPFFTAVNIDGPQVVDVPRDGDWTIDSRIRREHQLGNEAYKGNDIDKGHQVRRRDAAWGPHAHRSANDTFAYTNASLQHAALNQKEWLQLENHVLDQVKSKGMKATVLTGPVMKDSDPLWDNRGRMDRPTRMPQEFWKMVVWNDPQEGTLKGAAFVLSQEDFVGDRGLFKSDFESGRFELYQVPIEKLEQMTRLSFGDLKDAHPEARRVETSDELRWL